MPNDDLANLAKILRQLGADKGPADVMARQLLKRADQMAEERSTTRIEALDYLLKVTIAGRDGRVHEGNPPGSEPTMRD